MRKYFNKIRELVEVNIMTRTVMLLLVTIIEYSHNISVSTDPSCSPSITNYFRINVDSLSNELFIR